MILEVLQNFTEVRYFNDLGAVCWRATASPFVQLTGNVMYSAVGCLKFHCSLGATAIVGAFHNIRKEYPWVNGPYGILPPLGTTLLLRRPLAERRQSRKKRDRSITRQPLARSHEDRQDVLEASQSCFFRLYL